jgi:hypothetical protein
MCGMWCGPVDLSGAGRGRPTGNRWARAAMVWLLRPPRSLETSRAGPRAPILRAIAAGFRQMQRGPGVSLSLSLEAERGLWQSRRVMRCDRGSRGRMLGPGRSDSAWPVDASEKRMVFVCSSFLSFTRKKESSIPNRTICGGMGREPWAQVAARRQQVMQRRQNLREALN